MIVLHRINGSELVINSQHIETLEATPDTVIMLTTERRYIVKEGVDEIIQKVIDFNKAIVGNTGKSL